MSDGIRLSEGRRELIELCRSIISGNEKLLEGVRRICVLRFVVEDPENEVFLIIRAIEADTDTIPVGLVRESYATEYLAKIDGDLEDYWDEMRSQLIQACSEIVDEFTQSSVGQP